MVVDSFATGSLRAGISSGLDNDGTGRPASRLFFSNPTPGRANDSSSVLSGYCAQPIFSREGGYVESSFALSITTATDGASIYYTLDGSTPTERSALYTGPIEISGIQTVRAIASAPGKLVSEESVATYLLGVAHDLPIVCLSMTQSDLDYVFASTERRDIRERAGYVEYYEAGGKLGVSFPAGFRIAGNGTRLYAQRSINLYLRGGYGRSSVVYPFFEDYEIKEFKSLSLRNMGQDVSLSRIRDAYFSMAVKGMNLDLYGVQVRRGLSQRQILGPLRVQGEPERGLPGLPPRCGPGRDQHGALQHLCLQRHRQCGHQKSLCTGQGRPGERRKVRHLL